MNIPRSLQLASALLIASTGFAAEIPNATPEPNAKTMNPPSVSLGYAMLYVKDVAASLAFYEEAFGLPCRFFNDDNGNAYGELETGAARLAFISLQLAREQLHLEVVPAAPNLPPPGMEIALVTSDVPALFARTVKAGAVVVSPPETKPWGQTVALLRDNSGYLVDLCTPLP